MKKPGQLKISSTYFENLAENCKLKKKKDDKWRLWKHLHKLDTILRFFIMINDLNVLIFCRC